MKTFLTVLGIILLVVIIVLVVLYFLGRKLQRKQAEQERQMEAMKQVTSIFVIDKGKLKLKDAKLPAAVLEQTPKYMRGIKFPIVKAKIGPRIMSLICDGRAYELIPIGKTIKATISGIYITDVKATGSSALLTPPKKKGPLQKLRKKARDTVDKQQKGKK